MKTIKILLVSNASWTMIKFRRGLIQALLNQQYEVYVIAPCDTYTEEIKKLGCKYLDIKIDNKGSNPFKDLKLIYNLYKIYKKINPDLVIHYTIKLNIYGSFAAKMAKIKSIAVIPGLGYTFINDTITTKIAKYLYKIALTIPNQVWFINQDDQNEFLTQKLVEQSKIRNINSEGINTDYFKPINQKKDSSKFIFLMIARVLRDKGIYEYVEAASIIKLQYENVKFELLGPIYTLNPTSISKEEINKWEIDGIITYLPEARDVRKYIADADCIVLPSYREGKGMTLVEGASMGKPLIATNVAGCKDVVDNGVNGYLCEVRNSIDLANKMKMILKRTEEERKIMGEHGRKKVLKEFDEKIIIAKYFEGLRELLG